MLSTFLSKQLISGCSAEWGGRFRPVILMYHGSPEARRNAASHYDVAVTQFREQLLLLKGLGWRGVSIRDCLSLAAEGMGEKVFAITFDDGYLNNFRFAVPLLLELDMTATWFITSGVVGKKAHWLSKQGEDAAIMGWAEIEELNRLGFEIGGHSHSHIDFRNAKPNEVEVELGKSRAILEQKLGADVLNMAYPFGRVTPKVIELTQQAGYRTACTTMSGRADFDNECFRLRRVTVNLTDSAASLARKIAFADNDVGWYKVGKYYLSRFG